MTKRLPLLLGFSLCAALLLVACGGANTNTATTNSGATNTAATPASGSSTTASTGDKIGVAECDDFIAKYESCVNSKVPEAARATVKTSLETWRNSWRELAKTPQGKAGLAQACKSAHEQAKTSMGAYGCTW